MNGKTNKVQQLEDLIEQDILQAVMDSKGVQRFPIAQLKIKIMEHVEQHRCKRHYNPYCSDCNIQKP